MTNEERIKMALAALNNALLRIDEAQLHVHHPDILRTLEQAWMQTDVAYNTILRALRQWKEI